MSNVRRHAFVLFAALIGAAFFVAFLFGGQAKGQDGRGAIGSDAQGRAFVRGELIVSFEPGLSDDAKNRAVEAQAARVERSIPEIGVQVLSFPRIAGRAGERQDEALMRVKEALEEAPGVEAVDFNYLRRVNYVPNDARFGKQYALRRIKASRAWNETRGSLGTKIAIVDSGIRDSHPDLNAKVVAQRDFVNGDRKAEDTLGHGTHVAGIAAAETNNGTGTAGVCPECTLMAAKVVGRNGTGTTADAIAGIVWSAKNGAKVINVSIGAYGYVKAEHDAVKYAAGKGAVLIAAAGNDNVSTKTYIAAYPEVIAVAATNNVNRRAKFSNKGRWVDVAAPGVGIVSTFPSRGYRSLSGTSFSAPHVAGVAGLLASQGRSPAEIRRRILGTARDLGPRGKDTLYGHGLVDAEAATR
jgi:thermitase